MKNYKFRIQHFAIIVAFASLNIILPLINSNKSANPISLDMMEAKASGAGYECDDTDQWYCTVVLETTYNGPYHLVFY